MVFLQCRPDILAGVTYHYFLPHAVPSDSAGEMDAFARILYYVAIFLALLTLLIGMLVWRTARAVQRRAICIED